MGINKRINRPEGFSIKPSAPLPDPSTTRKLPERSVRQSYKTIDISTSGGFTNKRFEVACKVLVFRGVVDNNDNITTFGSQINVKIGAIDNENLILKPNDVIIFPETISDLFFSSTNIIIGDYNWRFFIFDNIVNFISFENRIGNAGNYPALIPIDDTNFDNKLGDNAVITQARLYGFDGSFWDRLKVDGSGNLLVSSLISNAELNIRIKDGDGSGLADVIDATLSDSVSNTINVLATAGLGYVFNETNWDRLRGTAAKGAYVQIAGSPKTFGRFNVSVSTSGDTTLVAAAGAGVKIKVLSYSIFVGAASNVSILNGSAGSKLAGQFNFVANQGIVEKSDLPDAHLFETSANTALIINQSAAIQLCCRGTYYTET